MSFYIFRMTFDIQFLCILYLQLINFVFETLIDISNKSLYVFKKKKKIYSKEVLLINLGGRRWEIAYCS